MNMTTNNVEERFATLEAQVARLEFLLKKSVIANELPAGRTSPDFLDTMFGIHADSPNIEEVSQRIEAERERERQEAQRNEKAERT